MSALGRARGFGGGKLPPAESVASASEVRSQLAAVGDALAAARHAVVFTGAGLSTAAGLADVSGRRGHANRAYERKTARKLRPSGYEHPTMGHMALASLVGAGIVRLIVSTNADALHAKSGVPASKLALLRGTATDLEMEAFAKAAPGATVAERETLAGLIATNPRLSQLRVELENKVLCVDEVERTLAHVDRADVVVVVGCGIAAAVHEHLLAGFDGALFIIGLQESVLDDAADDVIRCNADTALVSLVAALDVPLSRYVVRMPAVVTATLLQEKPHGKTAGKRHWRVSVSSEMRGPLDVEEVLFEVPRGMDGPQHVLVNANPFELVCSGKGPAGEVVVTLFFRRCEAEDFPPSA
ncbi:histone deacetylase [Thecamonas trahens ATCC 50062]|uniref:protein acetyllysine N-acetyltransferase n=1 Tax=Thecamonas trahens ATCC 50062 TaxID=461836 RepID=A0A0L0DST0_THETB|nr:histone deacetylase [Thecamonas trahens ATCC 50062]KNC55330.1 histone deacetylase [Thecamonas trahens ATCC 50062]|eukprot:XP_013753051.1 histone deacetylase [Thecamonas trahens ATCC 50062]